MYIKPENLHSNMVRFIILNPSFSKFKVRFIYIPIWLDLLSKQYTKN